MDTGKEKYLLLLLPIQNLHQDYINHIITSNNYTQDFTQIHNFQTHLPSTFSLSLPDIYTP